VRAAGIALAIALAGVPAAARGHHLGAYTPRDNAISANFKQIKFSVEAGKFDVARRLFDEGAVRREMRERAAALPPGLEAATRAALGAGDAPEVERALTVFLAALARNLAVEAQRTVNAPGIGPEARAAAGRLFLEAIWRYYNLIDYAVSRRAPKTSVAVRLAFDDAESVIKGPAVAGGTAPGAAGATAAGNRPSAPTVSRDPAKLSEPLQRIAQALGELIETSSPRTRRQS
jgi:hypothetical protein